MSKLFSFLAAAFFVAAAPNAHAWGNDGHEIIGAIADRLIAGTNAEKHVKALLQTGETLQSISTWLDCAKGYCGPLSEEMRQFTRANPDHHEYHYCDVPIQKNYYVAGEIGTSDHDLVLTLKQAIAVLSGQDTLQTNPRHFTQRQALLVVAHLVGDIHQPLHVGALYHDAAGHPILPGSEQEVDGIHIYSNKGGNYLMLGSRNLHEYWDTVLVRYALRKARVDSPDGFAREILSRIGQIRTTQGAVEQWPIAWADDTLRVARDVQEVLVIGERGEASDRYGKTVPAWPVTAPRTYAKVSTALAAEQLTKAGHRLAALLKAIWP